MRSHNYRNLIINLGLVVFSLATIVAIGELYLRFSGYDALKDLKNGREMILQLSSNSDVKYELVPGSKGYAWGANVEINAHGYRGKMSSTGKFNGFRIIALGDSITFGNMLPVEDSYSYQLNKLLNKSIPRYDVINFGVGGYDILQDVSLLEHRGLIYKPDLAVIGFCLNDIGIASPNLEYIIRSQRYQSSLIFHLRVAQFIADKIDRIRISNWMQEKNEPEVFRNDYKTRIARIGEDEHTLRELMQTLPKGYPSDWYRDEYRIGRLRYSFERLSDLAKRENFSVVVVIFPFLAGDSTDYPYEIPHKIITMEAKRVGFDVQEVVHEFMDIGMNNLKISKNDLVHPNKFGHKIVAEKLGDYIHNKWPKLEEQLSSSTQQRTTPDHYRAGVP